MRNPMDVIGAAARSDDAARYGVGLTVLKALRAEYGKHAIKDEHGFRVVILVWLAYVVACIALPILACLVLWNILT